MSQRKEKYLRNALKNFNRVDNLDREVAALHRRVTEVGRDVEMVMDTQATDHRRARAARDNRRRAANRAEWTLRIAALALGLSVAALIATFVNHGKAQDRWNEIDAAMASKTARMVVETQTTEYIVPELETMQVQTVPVSDLVPLTAEEQESLWTACQEFGIPYTLALGVIDVETDFRNVAGDDGNSKGYMQVQERYHTDTMRTLGVADLMESKGNFRVGLSYLSEMVAVTDTTDEALMAYNMGKVGAARLWQEGVHESAYSREVLERASYWENQLAQR